ncbi:MAG: DUF5916 domain-containing protein [Saprospiraceae bacterium]|nr:DUF5916 domain-containing protein [Saprospiraceae bacterium]
MKKQAFNFIFSATFTPLSIFIFLSLFSLKMSAQAVEISTDTAKYIKNPKPALKATRIAKPPKIDGQNTDDCWKGLPVADDFVMHQPQPYKKSGFKTEVKIAYDDVAIYILGYLYDPEPAKIGRELGARDDLDVAVDIINIGFDTYNDDQNAFRFGMTAAGVQFDSRISNGSNSDFSWDAVWQSAVSLQKDGWIAEYRIPFSALRFAEKNTQTWGLQIARSINRTTERGSWAGVDPKIDGLVIQYGALTDLENIKPPLRLQLSPYLAAGVQSSPSYDPQGNFTANGTQTQYSGGLDLKYGLNQSFTLDMTLIPNFGQVQSDNKVLNLSPFEVQYNENRPFFTEGSEIFSKGDIFYSRRIGGEPDGYYNVATNKNEFVKNNPAETQLYNATKISGRTKNNLGVGFLNAITAPMFATIENAETGKTRQVQTGVLTNYNVFVLNQALKNNSEISFTNAATLRDGDARDANVSSLFTRLRDKKSKYEYQVSGRLSQIFEKNADPNRGFTTFLAASKVSGSWTGRITQEILDDKWNPNDLGIFYGNNYINHGFNVQYQQIEPNKVFLTSQSWFNVNHNLQYSSKRFMDVQIETGFWGKFKSQWWVNIWQYLSPTNSYDFFEPRAAGKEFKRPPMYITGSNFGSDQRKKFYWYTHVSYGGRPETGYNRLRLIIEPRYRVNNKLSFSLFSHYIAENNDLGYASADNQADNDIIFGGRDRTTLESVLSSKYTFSPKANLTFRARHYWSKVVYDSFYKLTDDGSLSPKTWTTSEDRNFNIFNIDMVYTWQFAPGSFVNLIWKNNIATFEKGSKNIRDMRYLTNLGDTFNAPQTNGLTLKVIYFMDYQDIQHRFKVKPREL